MEIDFFNGNKHELEILARWQYDWWAKEAKWTIGQTEYYLKQCCKGKRQIPFIVIAREEKNIIGMCRIDNHGMEIRPDLFPWLMGLYVIPSNRNKKVATQLINFALNAIKQQGIKTCYLYTKLLNFYEKKGWEMLPKSPFYDAFVYKKHCNN